MTNFDNFNDFYSDLKYLERLAAFESHESKQKFLRLQIELLDDFRLRLAQLINNPGETDNFKKWPFSIKYFAIFNGLNYLEMMLDEWQFNTVHILHLF